MTSSFTTKSIYRADYFNRWPWLLHGVTTKNWPAAGQDQNDSIRQLTSYLDVPACQVVTAAQEHSNRVRVVSELTLRKVNTSERQFSIQGVDALVTNLPETMLVIRTADCVPLQIVDPLEHIVAVAHAGWKGTLGRILQNVLREFVRLGSRPANIYIHAGPHVCGDHYEVGEQRLDLFRQHFPDAHENFIAEGRLDLARCNVMQALEMGVPENHITISDVCTVHNNDQFYSYRANEFKKTGDNLTFMMIQRTGAI